MKHMLKIPMLPLKAMFRLHCKYHTKPHKDRFPFLPNVPRHIFHQKTYYQDNSENLFEKELRLKKHIELEDEGKFDIGDCNIYYSFEGENLD